MAIGTTREDGSQQSMWSETAALPRGTGYPQAIVRMIGAGHTHESKTKGIEAQLASASTYTGWPAGIQGEPSFDDVCFGPAHDRWTPICRHGLPV